MKTEQIILGTILLEPNTFDIVNGQINSSMFYDKENRLIYESILMLHKKGQKIDLLTVSNDLRGRKLLDAIGGAFYLSSLTSNIGSAAHIDSHLRIFIQDYIRREMFVIFNKGLQEIADETIDIVDIYGQLTQNLDNLFDIKKNDISNMSDVMVNRIDEIIKRKPGETLGIETGLNSLNEITKGWQPADLIILAARPSMGKTAISLLLSKNPVIFHKKRCLYFSLEMSKERLSDRILSLESTINSELIQANKLNQAELSTIYDIIDKYSDTNFLINDESALTVEQIRSISIIENRKNKIDFIVIDYLQLIRHSLKGNKNTNDQVTHITSSLKALGKLLKVPIIALSQLSREVEKRTVKVPMLSDLRDSGAIEQDADLVIFIYRDEYYNNLSEEKNIIRLIFAKNRNGRIGTIPIYKNENWSYLSDIPFEQINEIPDF